MDAVDVDRLFALTPPPGLGEPAVSPLYDPSSIAFLESIHKRKSEMLKEIVASRGWPDKRSYDGHAEAAAFMIVQHADYDPDFQKLCHTLMLENARHGRSSPGFLAFLTDRILCNEGRHQRFGTQIREVENGCFVPKPIEDPDAVDDLRAQAGITEPLTDYLQRVNGGDMLLYRPLLNDYAEELEARKENKVIAFPGKKERTEELRN